MNGEGYNTTPQQAVTFNLSEETKATSFENIEGTLYGDNITGNSEDNEIRGRIDDDVIYGGAGNDTIYGEQPDGLRHRNIGIGRYEIDPIYSGTSAGNDTIMGNGSDILYGNKGIDALLGGDGDDELYGGEGDDILNGGVGADALYGNDGADEFRFESGTGSTNLDNISIAYDYVDGTDKLRYQGVLLLGYQFQLQLPNKQARTPISIRMIF